MLPKVIVLCVLFGLTVASRSRSLDLLSKFKDEIEDDDLVFDNIAQEYRPAEESHHESTDYRQAKFVGEEFTLSRLVGKQREVRVFSNGIIGLETQIPELGEDGLHIRQVTNGRKLLQLIFTDAQTLVDCDIDRSRLDVGKFVGRFFGAPIKKVANLRNHDGTLQVQSQYILSNLNSEKQNINATLSKIPVGSRPLTGWFASVVAFDTLKDECRRLHHNIEKERRNNANLPQEDEQEVLTNDRSFFEEEHKHVGRSKRDVPSSEQAKSRVKRAMFIMPGTNWCGSGNSAAGFGDLGDDRSTDKCCRSHDFCPYTIEGFTTKYGMFNYRFHTVSHCECDLRFRNCLKQVGTSAADTVGKLFFDYMGLKCFVFAQDKVCVKRSWWGRCIKYSRKHTAVIKDADQF